MVGSLLRSVGFVIGKVPGVAYDEAVAVAGALGAEDDDRADVELASELDDQVVDRARGDGVQASAPIHLRPSPDSLPNSRPAPPMAR